MFNGDLDSSICIDFLQYEGYTVFSPQELNALMEEPIKALVKETTPEDIEALVIYIRSIRGYDLTLPEQQLIDRSQLIAKMRKGGEHV